MTNTTRAFMNGQPIPDDGSNVITLTIGQLRALFLEVSSSSYREGAQKYAQAGADAAVRDLEARGLLRSSRPVTVKRVERDDEGRITAIVETLE